MSIRKQAELVRRETNIGLLSSEELRTIGHWAMEEDLEFAPLAGDQVQPQRSWLGKGNDTLFCTLDAVKDKAQLQDLTKIRLHAYQSRSINWLAMFGRDTRSRICHGHLSAIGFSTSLDAGKMARQDGIHRFVGRPNENHEFWSQPLADFQYAKASKVRVEYAPNSGCIAALIILDAMGQELTSWKQYGQGKVSPPAGLKCIEQEPPDERSGWRLAGFWGHADSRIINSVGAIWKE